MVRPVPPNSVVVGVARADRGAQPQPRPGSTPDLDHGRLPDTIGDTLAAVVARVEQLEQKVNGGGLHVPAIHAPDHGVWHGEEFLDLDNITER